MKVQPSALLRALVALAFFLSILQMPVRAYDLPASPGAQDLCCGVMAGGRAARHHPSHQVPRPDCSGGDLSEQELHSLREQSCAPLGAAADGATGTEA
mgnify:CR=1 FL=1